MNANRFENKIVLITGGNSGIGLATARRLATEGATVIISGRHRETLDRATQDLGERTEGIVVGDARKAFAAAGSMDKHLRIFSEAEGGAEHVQADEPDAARQLIADWFALRFGTQPPSAERTPQ
jgi:NAD(P)-dependent dehydrogenase (short-subunit alcohol dehydrogenase family)